jgi:DNA-binding XRE family transcriptional regulator
MKASGRVVRFIKKRLDAEARYREDRHIASEGLSEFLKDARTEMNMTQQELADALGVTATYISKAERGRAEVGLPLMQSLLRLIESTGAHQ